MAKRKSRKKKGKFQIGEYTPVYLTQYEITDEPIEEPAYRQLPKSVKEQLERLHHDAQFHPKTAIVELLKLKKRYPQVPQIYNYLAVAYSRTGEAEKSEAITKENMRQNPNYLFAKINYAEFCLEREEYEKIPEIFEQKYDLQMLYPERKKFHVSEFG
jgi:tetratricopeptide (TPR) repeat protein